MGGSPGRSNYATYTYTADWGVPGQNGWQSAYRSALLPPTSAQTAQIMWEWPDATVGMAVYQAATNYDWGFDVNVIAVTPTPGGSVAIDNNGRRQYMYANESFTINGPLGNSGLPTNGHYENVCNISANGVAARVEPLKQRGVRFINVGFIQIVTIANQDATYTSTDGTITRQGCQYFQNDPMDGTTALDIFTDSAERQPLVQVLSD